MKIFHHTDLDGFCSGAIALRKFPDARALAYNYFYDPAKSIDTVEKDEAVMFVDITPTPNNLKRIMSITSDITIIDHHASSLKDLEEAGLSFPGMMIKDGIGACVLTWMYLFPNKVIPRGVQCIGEYDAWQRTDQNKAFNFGIKTFNTFPTNAIWDKIFNDEEYAINGILMTGRKVMSYLIPWYKRLIKSYGITGTVHGHTALMINQPNVDSSVFDNIDGSFDIYLRVVFGKGWKWLVSITTDRDDIDVSEIASQYGGGGHTKSAGFSIDSLDEFFIK